MDEDELRIGKKRRSSNPAIALAEEAVRMQHEVVAELRRKAATRIAEDAAAKKATDKDKTTQAGDQKDATAATGDKGKSPSPERMVPRISNPHSTLDIEA